MKFAAENFDGVELVDEPKTNVWELRDDTDSIKDQLSTTDLRITLHATYRDLNVASINPSIRRVSLDQIATSIGLAHKLGAEVVTIHPGKIAGRKISRTDCITSMAKSLKELSDYAEELGILLAIENMAGSKKLCTTIQEILEILNAVNSDNLGVTVDFSHVYLMAISPKRTVDSLKKKLFNIHLSDFRGETDHLSLGGGIVNLSEIFDLLHDVGYKNSVVLETWYSKDPLQGAMASARAMVPLIKKHNQSSTPESEEACVPEHASPGAGFVQTHFPVPAD